MAKKNPAAVSTSDVSRVMAAMGRKGGQEYARKHSAEERVARAKDAAKARWDKERKAKRKPAGTSAAVPKAR